MRSRYFTGLDATGFHRLHYTEWGEPDAPVVVCVHGLTQNARGFDALAEALAPTHRVVCLDVAGRGGSERLINPSGYDYPQYLADVNALFARLDVETLDFVGTSMGGVIGMLLAAQRGHPIRRLVMNDVGPFIPKAALGRIRDYVGHEFHFDDIAGLEAHMRRAYAPFGPLSDAQWRKLAEEAARANPDGSISQNYDPAIAVPIKAAPLTDVDLWAFWDLVSCPVLLLRGAESDLLSAETAAEMQTRGPQTILVEFAGVGHAPALLDADQIEAVTGFLAE